MVIFEICYTYLILGMKGKFMINLQLALLDPGKVFDSPQAVLLCQDISRDQKIMILKRWESDMREIQVAEEENMQGKDLVETYEAILNALHTLDADINLGDSPPTKQGG